MCGIVGYIGERKALPTLLEALGRLEYRGYDSAGVAVVNSDRLEVCKRVGKLTVLVDAVRRRPLFGHLGVGHCLLGDTLIQLADGRVARIDSLRGEIIVLALDSTTLSLVPRKARAWSHPAPEQLIEIRIPFGQVVCTPQHRLFTVDQDGNLTQKTAADLRQGDLLLHASGVEGTGLPMAFQSVGAPRYYRLGERARLLIRTGVSRVGRRRLAQLAGVHAASIDHLQEASRNAAESVLQPLAASLRLTFPLADSAAVDSRHGTFVQLPTVSSSELMQWMGYLLGDGHVGRRGIRFKDADQDALKVYRDVSERCFHVKGRIVPIPNVSAFLLELNSIGLADWVRLNVLNRRRQFLEEIGALPAEQLAGFLRGLFDAEGGVARQAGQVALTMTDADLVRRVQLWLLRFDIIASGHDVKAAPAQRRPQAARTLHITRRDALTAFRTHIGFSSARKCAWLNQVMASKRDGFYLSSRAIPVTQVRVGQRLREAGVPSAALRPYRGGHRFTDGQAAKLLELLHRFPGAVSVVQLLQRWLNAGIRAQEILSVRRVPSHGAMVYDLEVEGAENFFANGILSHNSRWATHGEPSERNAHPHLDCSGRIAVVHNGIIENYATLKGMLRTRGHSFRSDTDTEVLAHLIEEHAKQLPLAEATRRALGDVEGSYAICVVSQGEPRQLIAARHGSPLVLGVGQHERFVASDVPALLGYTRHVIYLQDGELAVLTGAQHRLMTLGGHRVQRSATAIRWSLAAAQKGGYPHFMLKEIHEQPRAIADTLANRLVAARDLQFDRRTREFLNRHVTGGTKLIIISCGTAYHAGLVGEYLLEEYVALPVDVDLASEFRYRAPLLDANTTVLAITQSGETADTLAGIRLARAAGAKILSICNVMGSSIARESDAVLYTHAGPEIAVASTKAYTAQLTALYLLMLYLARERGTLAPSTWTTFLKQLAALPRLAEAALRTEPAIKRCAARYAKQRNFYYLGRRYNYPAALEGALKLKEVCPLIHAEGYAAGEMKHGPIALIRKGWPVVCLAPHSSIYAKMRSNIEEIRARHGEVIAVVSAGDRRLKGLAQQALTIPPCEEPFSPPLIAIPLQLLAYHIARWNRCDIDQPPNLAKSVTVE